MAGLSSSFWLIVINSLFYAVTTVLTLPSQPNFGCLFSESLCDPQLEICFNDGLFGRCQQIYESDRDVPPLRFELSKKELASLIEEMEALFAEGYDWHHPRTQCIVQEILSSFHARREYSKILCDTLREQLSQYSPQEGDELEDSDMAYIRYKPSDLDPKAEFADEVYSPPGLDENIREDEENSESDLPLFFSKTYNTPDGFRTGFESKDTQSQEDEEPVVERRSEGESHFRKHYSTPQEFREASSHHHKEESVDDGGVSEVMRRSLIFDYDAQDFDTDPADLAPQFSIESAEDLFPDDKQLDDKSVGFSEGGLVFSPDRVKDLGSLAGDARDLSDLLDELDEWSFQRSERLDVKKPGPQFSTNNYAFQDTSTKKVPQSEKPEASAVSSVEGQKETMPSELPNHPPKRKVQSRTLWFQSILGDPHKKGVKSSHYSSHYSPYTSHSKDSTLQDSDQYHIVDTTYTYIAFKESVNSWSEGNKIIKAVATLLKVPSDMFSHERIDQHEVTFKVNEPNAKGWNASQVAKKIDGVKDELKKMTGVVVTSVGVGDKNKLPMVVKLNDREEETYVVIVIVCGALSALALSASVLYLTRVHGNKLANMTASDTEPSKHYQDLCRARMSSKNGDNGSAAPPHRVASLSRESDNSPSSRSSTSSWSEEPALSNMDMATGQMVLSYMEEHLKNKDRLESEWAALCAYKADPCASTVAEQEENRIKNRGETGLPYDHARVVLNQLSNITESHYINASTISDHDPRNAAYIVTQGPLANTAPDFWQMVWEQGCVVIVMLTRLVENDTTMCHRYWPAEGSEIYHIFEVHLVSEHIWCDDYLVRSFYLKNMKTGETRTVTQFHFLSWPEGSVPNLTKPLLEFRRKVNKSFRGRSCPIVVHCSDGVGRSGTYCLLDMVLNRMAKGAKEIDVAATLEHIRDQRAGALATPQQFRFVISAVSDELQAILRVHPQANQ